MRPDKHRASIGYNEPCCPDPAPKRQLESRLVRGRVLRAHCARNTHLHAHERTHSRQLTRTHSHAHGGSHLCPRMQKTKTIHLLTQHSHTIKSSVHTLFAQSAADLHLKSPRCVRPAQRDRHYHRRMSSSPWGTAPLLSTPLSFSFSLSHSVSLAV